MKVIKVRVNSMRNINSYHARKGLTKIIITQNSIHSLCRVLFWCESVEHHIFILFFKGSSYSCINKSRHIDKSIHEYEI